MVWVGYGAHLQVVDGDNTVGGVLRACNHENPVVRRGSDHRGVPKDGLSRQEGRDAVVEVRGCERRRDGRIWAQ
eukprot:scaffold223877_cov23-Prasinocladus_malaysianus.AAC.1